MGRLHKLDRPGERIPRPGIYLLHLDRPLVHAKHYLGFSPNLTARLADHERGAGARLTQVAKERGITWTLAAVWPNGSRQDERRLKRGGSSVRYCPICPPRRR